MLIVEAPNGRTAEREYILSVVLGDELGLPFELVTGERRDWRITLAGESGAVTLPDALLGIAPAKWLTRESLPARPLERWRPPGSMGADPTMIPVLFGSPGPAAGPGEQALPIDVFGSAFFMLTRYEEHVLIESDAHGRFPAAASLAWSEGFLDRPIVNELCEALWHVLSAVWPRLRRRDKVFSIELTHDVDWLSSVRQPLGRVGRLLAGDLLRRRDADLFARRSAAVVRERAGRGHLADPVDTFDFIMDASEERGLRSAFYFIADADRSATFHNEGYSLEAAEAQRLLRSIHDRGHEIGLHGSYVAWRDSDLLAHEFRRLLEATNRAGIEQDTWGGRQHFLRFSAAQTWRAWAAAGLQYDASVGFAEAPGFRCGIAGPFRVFDVSGGALLDLVERPLIAMEGSFLDRQYGAMPIGSAIERILALAGTCRRYGGTFTLLWHNSSLARKIERHAYCDVLDGLTTPH